MTSNINSTSTAATQPVKSWKYNNDGVWEYDTQKQMTSIENTFNVSIDADKFKTAVKGDKFTDATLYSVFDKDSNGTLSLDELSTVIKSTSTPTPVTNNSFGNYGSDGKYAYDLEEFAATLEKQSSTEIDRTKLRDVFYIPFSDKKDITDEDIFYTLDTNRDFKLDDSEMSSLVDSIKKPTPVTTGTNNDALLKDVHDMMKQITQVFPMMMQEMMMMQRTMMQQMMQRPSTKPIGMPTFPNNVMPTFPNNMMPALGTESLNAGLFPSLGAPRANNSGQDMLANLMKYIQQSTTAAK